MNNGSIIGKLTKPTISAASGRWGLDSQYRAQSLTEWPADFIAIEHITTSTLLTVNSTQNHTGINLSSITLSDALIILADGELNSGTPGIINSVVADGVTMNTVIKTDGTNCSVQGIFFLNGADVTGNTNATVSINFEISGPRSSVYVFRLINGANFSIADTDESYSTGASTQTNVVDFSNPKAVLFTNGYYANRTGHTFTAGVETEYNGVQENGGSGDAGINQTPTTSSHTITYTRGGATNTQGDSLITAVLIP